MQTPPTAGELLADDRMRQGQQPVSDTFLLTHPTLTATRKRNSSFVCLQGKAPKIEKPMLPGVYGSVETHTRRRQGRSSCVLPTPMTFLSVYAVAPAFASPLYDKGRNGAQGTAVSQGGEEGRAHRVPPPGMCTYVPATEHADDCPVYTFPGKKPLQFVIPPSRTH